MNIHETRQVIKDVAFKKGIELTRQVRIVFVNNHPPQEVKMSVNRYDLTRALSLIMSPLKDKPIIKTMESSGFPKNIILAYQCVEKSIYIQFL